MQPLSRATTSIAFALLAWYALNFVGVPGLVRAESLLSLAGLMLALLAALVVGGARHWPAVAPASAVACLVWLLLQIDTHWWTYLVADADAKRLAWYTRNWGDLVRVLPERPGRTVPDLYHSVLALLLVATLLGSIRDAVRSTPRRPPVPS